MKSVMTVNELINLLNNFNGDVLVRVDGGEGSGGEWSELAIVEKGEKMYGLQQYKIVKVLMEGDE